MSAGDLAFDALFARCSGGRAPYEYQRTVAERLLGGAHVEVWAPTGAGKTLAVLVPFLLDHLRSGRPRWDRLIYVLPLRSLVESIAAEIQRVAGLLGWCDFQVRMQTGERPDDAFFSEGQVIVTTYDQFLSGALEGPYGVASKLHNINAAAAAGALVVFDEYHLMHPRQAFLTSVVHIEQYKRLCQSVWMTATATSPLQGELRDALDTEPIKVQPAELASIPAVAKVERRVRVCAGPLTAAAVVTRHRSLSIALVNTVTRANELYDEIKTLAPSNRVILLHAQFFPPDRRKIEQDVRYVFRERSTEQAILVCTQVIEAGMNISAEVLHTEAARMSALVQRAGRCARFPGERGEVLIYPVPVTDGRWWLPYDKEDIEHSLGALRDISDEPVDATAMRNLVEAAHRATDAEHLSREDWCDRQDTVRDLVRTTVVLRKPADVSKYIRETDGQTVRVVLAHDPSSRRLNPYAVEGFGLRRSALYRLFDSAEGSIGWLWAPSEAEEWKPIQTRKELERAFVVCLRLAVATYTSKGGLRLGRSGEIESPRREPPAQRRRRPLHCESWARHAREVGNEAAARVEGAGTVLRDGLAGEPWRLSEPEVAEAARAAGLLHDVGKLQDRWQRWAAAAQRRIDSKYVYTVPLAHTDFDPEKPADRDGEREISRQYPRGGHAVASAWYSGQVVEALLSTVATPVSGELVAACLAAMLSHHGAWLVYPPDDNLGVRPLVCKAASALAAATGRTDLPALTAPTKRRSVRHHLERQLEPVTQTDYWVAWWPLVAYLTRTLRLADQRATSQYGGEE